MAACEACGRERRTVSTADTDQSTPRCRPCERLAEADVRVSPLSDDDLELVLAWRSNPHVYRHFRNQDGPLKWEDHVSWFESRPEDRYDYVLQFAGRRVGVVSLDADDAVSVYLGDVDARGQGVGTNAVEWLCDRFDDRAPLRAEIHEPNTRSQRLFERCGFTRRGRDGEWLQYEYSP